jgi:hypothetical protein
VQSQQTATMKKKVEKFLFGFITLQHFSRILCDFLINNRKTSKIMFFFSAVILSAVLAVTFADAKKISSMPSTWEEFALHHHTMENLFSTFRKEFGKDYLSKDHEKQHFSIFKGRVKSILDWNDPKKGNGEKGTYLKGINRFSDLSAEERRGFVMSEMKVDVSHVLTRFYCLFLSIDNPKAICIFKERK